MVMHPLPSPMFFFFFFTARYLPCLLNLIFDIQKLQRQRGLTNSFHLHFFTFWLERRLNLIFLRFYCSLKTESMESCYWLARLLRRRESMNLVAGISFHSIPNQLKSSMKPTKRESPYRRGIHMYNSIMHLPLSV